jgi:hypothetical protein
MKNKIVWLLTLLIVILAVALVVSRNYTKLTQTSVTPAQNKQPADTVSMSMVTVAQSDNFYNIQAEYPQFGNADQAFNQKIATLVTGTVDSFKKEAKDNFDARNATMPNGQAPLQNPEEPFDFVAVPTLTQVSPSYISFMIDIYYFSGGAHGIDQIFAFNYDLKNKKEISITDLVGSQAGLDKLAALALDQVTAQLQGNGEQINDTLKQMIAAGAKSTPDNYRNFTFGYGKLTVFFEQYQVAPGSAGTITTTFYKSDLDQNSINSTYLN